MPAFLSVKLQITVRLNLGLIRRLSDSVFIVVDDFYLTDFDSSPPSPLSLPLRWLYSPELQRSSLNASITQTSRYNDHLSSAWFWGSAVWSLMSHWMFCALTGPCCLFYHDPHCSFLISRGQMARAGGGHQLFFPLELIWNSNFGSNGDVNVFFPRRSCTRSWQIMISVSICMNYWRWDCFFTF